MNLQQRQALPPDEAAREVHRRLATALRPGQLRAAVAIVSTETQLALEFTRGQGFGAIGWRALLREGPV
jgi:hypothetical protein